jgi:uncharacterized protein
MPARTADVIAALRGAGASFAFLFGSKVAGTAGLGSDLDVAAWWPEAPPQPWEVDVPGDVDHTILNTAPLWLAGRVALHGELLFDDDPPRRVAWQADTRCIYLDEIPELRKRQREWLKAVTDG